MLGIRTRTGGRKLVDESTVLLRPAPKERKCVSVGTGLSGSGDGGAADFRSVVHVLERCSD